MFRDRIKAVKQKFFTNVTTSFYILLSIILIVFVLWISLVDTDDITGYINIVNPLTVEDIYHNMIGV